MFICQHCGCLSDPNEKPVRVVTETREKLYDNDGVITKGREIVRELLVHLDCVEKVKRSA